MNVKSFCRQAGIFIELITDCMFPIPIAMVAAITVSSALGWIKHTPNQLFWRAVFSFIFLTLFLITTVFLCKFVFARVCRADAIHTLFSNQALLRLQKIERFLRLNVMPLMGLTLMINMALAIAVWNGDGHNLQGSWLFTAGGTPIGITFAALAPLTVHLKTWKVILVKTNHWADGPYE